MITIKEKEKHNNVYDTTPFFFYKHNGYKHIEAEITKKKTKHTLSIYWASRIYDKKNQLIINFYKCQN